jgi:hypothetical protein
MDTMKKILCSLFLLATIGCESPPKKTPAPTGNKDVASSNIRVQEKAVESAAKKVDNVQNLAENVIGEVDSVRGVLARVEMPIKTRVETEEFFASIIGNSNMMRYQLETMKDDFVLIRGEYERFVQMGEAMDVQAKRIDYLENEAERLRNSALEDIYDYLVWVFILGFLVVIGGSVVAFFVSRKLGVSILAIGIVILGFGAAATFYLQWIAVTGFVLVGLGILSTVALLVYGIYEESSKKKKLENATIENVRLLDAVKKKLPEDSKEAIFGDGGVAQTIQNSDTQKIVAAVRRKTPPIIPPLT